MSELVTRAVVLGALLVVTVVLGVWWQRRQGVVRTARHHHPADDGAYDWSADGILLGPHRTFVQFSSEFCSPCRHTARVLGDLVLAHPDVTHREIDVSTHLDLVRAFGILRTPTVLVLDSDGREIARMSGSVNTAQAVRALETPSPALERDSA